MKKTTLLLLLLAGTLAGYADSGERNMAVTLVSANPDGSWRMHNAGVANGLPVGVSYTVEILPMANGVTAVSLKELGAGDAVPLGRTVTDEDFVYHSAKAMQRCRNEFLRTEPFAELPSFSVGEGDSGVCPCSVGSADIAVEAPPAVAAADFKITSNDP